jgi:hypothetical protein
MTTFRVFAARRAGAGFHPRRWLVIGSITMAGWNAAGRPNPAAMRRSPMSANTHAARRPRFHMTVFEPSYQKRDGCNAVEHGWLWAAGESTQRIEQDLCRERID